jgi:TRAP-type C4-dicarboxylate transport system permease small subunit
MVNKMDSLKVTSISTSLGLVYWTDIISGVLMCIMFLAQIYYLYLKTKKIKES